MTNDKTESPAAYQVSIQIISFFRHWSCENKLTVCIIEVAKHAHVLHSPLRLTYDLFNNEEMNGIPSYYSTIRVLYHDKYIRHASKRVDYLV